MGKVYKVAIIGCGRIASLLEDDPLRGKPASHSGAYHAHHKTKIIAGCDIDPDNLKAFGKRWKVKALYDDYRELLEREKPDIISVTTWTESHSEIVTHAAKSGNVKGIYCEKPIAINLTQAKRMIRTCKKHNVAMVVGHERRWDGRYQIIRNMLHSGALGEVKSMTGYALGGSPPKLSRKKFGGGPMFHDGTHLVDLFRFFGGDVESVTGFDERPFGNKCVESTAVGLIRFKNGATGLIIGGGERDYFHFEIDIHTNKARVVLGNHTAELYMAEPSKRYSGFTELTKRPFPAVNGHGVNAFVGGVADLIKEIETGERSISSGQDGYKALEIITALYKSASNGKAPIELPL
ncbi:hypothetical protein MNBD_NITROSPINAE01-1906 [hydrothermal vent metagenome]|uniref:Inositol 2-dehydrogenase n=1 Tax=hydrothermal vent metagenome TaxID=652676 RepID=A0A3B1CHV1_9ZZZZ